MGTVMHRVLQHAPQLLSRLVELCRDERSLSRRLGVSQAELARWVRGESAPGEEHLHAMVALLIKMQNQATRRRMRDESRKRELESPRKKP